MRKDDGTEIMIVQIAGIMARRVFTNAQTGNYVFRGEESGIIKFGSRVDLYLPLDADVKVKLYEQVKACLDVIAILPG
jgi:phosphatidylserine decarboxylase